MTKYAPVVPLYYSNGYYIMGSKVGGITLSSVFGGSPVYTNAYVKH
jgi:peptide/nickel transport system substrate-binding protein